MNTAIIERGRGPEIAGTRVTVYDIWDYARHGRHHTYIAAALGLSSDQVLSALKYIEDHKPEVLAEYQKIMDRIARGNAPEVEAKREASRAKLLALQRQFQKLNGHGGKDERVTS